MEREYPQPGFHFNVVFELFPGDVRFQEVRGLTVSTRFRPWEEGGENRFAHQLPEGLQFSDLVLKRGKFPGSDVLSWARRALEDFEFTPTNLQISLLDASHEPVYSWYVVHAIPKSLAVSGINAMRGEVVVETLTLSYQYFKHYEHAGAAGAA